MKLIQLNIWQGRLLREISSFLINEQPDILCLQEVYSSTINYPLFEMYSSYEHIWELFPGYNGFFASTYQMDLMGTPFEFGNAILSRYPLTDQVIHQINGAYRIYSSFDNFESNVRNLQQAVVHLNDERTFTLFNHHGYWERNAQGSEISKERMDKVAAIIKRVEGPIILAGDLNVNPDSPALESLQANYRDLTAEFHVQSTLSELGKVPNVACDHVFVSSEVNVEAYAASDVLVSDHKAVILEFDI